MTSSTLRARCASHDLAIGPDGRCVLCRREVGAPPRAAGSARHIGWLLAVLMVASAVLIGYRALSGARAPAPSAAAVDEGGPPVDLADATRRVHITVYSAAWCPHCQRAKGWLGTHGYAFSVVDVEESRDNLQALRRLNPRGSIPVLDIDGAVLVGFAEARTEQAIHAAAERRLAASR